MRTIHVTDIIGRNAISMQSGGMLYEHIHNDLIKEGRMIELDFDNVELFASPFFNSSIGLLLKDISIEELQKRLIIKNLSNVGRQLLNHVIKNAIKFYQTDPGIVKKAIHLENGNN